MAVAIPYDYVTAQGLIVPDTSSTLTTVQGFWTTAFGANLVVAPSTPQGVIISTEVTSLNATINNNAVVSNQINPNYAGGVFLDAILALTGTQRVSQTQTTVAGVTVTGVSGTTIPQGSQAQTAAGDLFATTSTVVIPSGGSTTVNFASVAYGVIPCAISALDTIVTGVLGWETVNNTVAGVTGMTTQSDQQARAFRNNTLAFQGISLAEAITSALYATTGVTSLFFQENTAATTATLNGITMVAHSIYACVEGGTNNAVAAALLENKSSGCAWNGGTTVGVIEPASLQTYEVLFDRPTQVGILVEATVHNISAAQVQNAVLAYAAGTVTDPAGNASGLGGFVVGGAVSPFEIAAAISIQNPQGYVSLCEVAISPSGTLSTTPVPISVNQIPYTQLSFITTNIV